MGMKIGKEYRFEAAHHLPNHMGRCAQPHGHGYRLEVEVTTEVGRESLIPLGPSNGGMVIDFAALDSIVKGGLLPLIDHTDLNVSALGHFGVHRPTAELLCIGIASWLQEGLKLRGEGVVLSRVRLWETEKCYAEWVA